MSRLNSKKSDFLKSEDQDAIEFFINDYVTPLDPEIFQKDIWIKQELSKAVNKFNIKPETGIKHLLSIKYIKEEDYFELAEFLMNTNEIMKDKLGEFFGKNDQLAIKV